MSLETRVIQVTNVAPATTKEQLKTLFQFIGRIRDCKLFPPEGSDQQVAAKVCYVEFEEPTSAGVALHLTNTVFIDRALIVVPVMDGKIPDERVAMQLTPQTVARMAPGQPSWPTNVVSQLTGTGGEQVIMTYDPRLNALGLPQYPPLPPSLDAAKVEEIRRTVYVGNLDPKTTPQSLMSFFSQAGEVKYMRMAGEDAGVTRAAYLELTDQRSVANYLGYSGVTLNGRVITVSHARSSINKPLSRSQEASRREVEEAMKKVHEAQALISAAASETRSRSRSRRKSHSHSRSRSRSKRRSRSRSRGHRRRSRSRSRRRSRSPRRVRRSQSRSSRRRHSPSRSGIVVIPAAGRRRSRSASRTRRRSRSRSRKRRSRTPPRSYAARRSKSRSRGPRRIKSRSRTPRRSRSHSRGKGKDKKEKMRDVDKKKKEKKASSRSLSPPTLKREGSAAPLSGDDRSPDRLDVRDRSGSPVGVRGDRSRSVSPLKASRRRSLSPRRRRSKSLSPRRSPIKKKKARSPRRSRSGSRHRTKKDKKKDRSRSKERREKEKKKRGKDKRESDREKGSLSSSSSAAASKAVPTRNYDEEERGFGTSSDQEEMDMRSQGEGEGEEGRERTSSGADRQLVDMDTSD